MEWLERQTSGCDELECPLESRDGWARVDDPRHGSTGFDNRHGAVDAFVSCGVDEGHLAEIERDVGKLALHEDFCQVGDGAPPGEVKVTARVDGPAAFVAGDGEVEWPASHESSRVSLRPSSW